MWTFSQESIKYTQKKEENHKCTALNFAKWTTLLSSTWTDTQQQLSRSGPQLVTTTPAMTMVLTLSARFGNGWTWNHAAGIFCVWLSFVQRALCGFPPRWYSSLIFHCCVPLSEYAIAYWLYGWWTFGCLVFDSHRQCCLEYSWTCLSYFSLCLWLDGFLLGTLLRDLHAQGRLGAPLFAPPVAFCSISWGQEK